MGRSMPRPMPRSMASIITLNLGVGCAPSCWPIFGFRNLLGAPRGRRGQFSVQSDNRFSGRGGGVGSLPRAWRRVGVPKAQQVLKKFVRLASAFPSPPTRSLSNRKGRGRRSGGREREPRRAGEGRLVWNRNFCVLIDYRLWAAKSKGRPWVDHCIEQCIMQCLDHHPEPRSGLCPELLADFRIPKPPGSSQGRRGQFSVQSE